MKTRVVAPTIGIVMALLAAGCGGGSDSSPEPEPPSPPPIGEPPPPPAPTAANSVAQVKADMTRSHDAVPTGLASAGPVVSQRTSPVGAVAMGGFGQVFVAPGNTAVNTRVQLRNFETYALRKSDGKWTRVQYSERVAGAFYPVNYTAGGTVATLRNEASGGVSVKPVVNQVFRFWPESGLTGSIVAPADVDGVFTTVQARLVQDNPAGADDRAAAQVVVNTAADWRATMSLYGTPVPTVVDLASGTAMGNGRLRFVLADWRAFNFESAAAEAQVDALDQAQAAGGTAPLANSTPTDVPRAKRVMVVGDSISEGGEGQDSYRRSLWNLLVSDATNPMVDFVGTRTGIRDSGGTCMSPAAASGPPNVPDFDQNHQAYWGWCVDTVNGALPAQLAQLAAPAVDRLPDIALVHLGTNDLLGGAAPAEITTGLSDLVSTLQSANPSIRILLARLIPMASGPSVSLLNGMIGGLASSSVTVVDQNTGFNAATDLRPDGVHPNDDGEAKIAGAWLAPLKAALQ
jgi:lysophospholipase L1-like esterase